MGNICCERPLYRYQHWNMGLSAIFNHLETGDQGLSRFWWLENHQKALEGWQRIRYPSRAKQH